MSNFKIEALPKSELHCHLDGSLPKSMVEEYTKKVITREMLSVSDDCTSLTEYLEKFDLPLQCLQDVKGLEAAAYAFSRASAEDKVSYVEVRFAPMLSTASGLTCAQIMDAVNHGMQRGFDDFGTDYGIIACAMRNHTLKQNLQMLEEVSTFYGKGLVAFDLAGDENGFPTYLFEEFFKKANEIKIPFTIHSGETGNVDNVKLAYEYGARRIGHGIALKKDKGLLRAYADAGIGVEMCPTSNFQTKAAIGWADYPLPEFLDAGISVSINTDNRTVSNTTLTRELTKVYEQYGRDEGMIRLLLDNALKTKFK